MLSASVLNAHKEGRWARRQHPWMGGGDSHASKILCLLAQTELTKVSLPDSVFKFAQLTYSSFEPNSLTSLQFLPLSIMLDPILPAQHLRTHPIFYHDFCRWLITSIIWLIQLSEGTLSFNPSFKAISLWGPVYHWLHPAESSRGVGTALYRFLWKLWCC